MPTSAVPAKPYRGDFVAWTGGCVFMGTGGGVVPPHSHYAIQIVMGRPDGLRVMCGSQASWQPCPAMIIPSRVRHAIDVTDCDWNAVFFVEPDTLEGKSLTARLRGKPEPLTPEVAGTFGLRLEQAWLLDKDERSVKDVCAQFIRELAQTSVREPADLRVQEAISWIRQRLDRPISLKDVAAVTHLSTDRFRHLFVSETGIPLRTYVLWRRFIHVWELLMQGHSLSTAAHAAGFSDSAHLSRTSRAMFGNAPSALPMKGPLSEKLKEPPHDRGSGPAPLRSPGTP